MSSSDAFSKASMTNATPAQLKKWNALLAKRGLSVWEGTDHRLVYTENSVTLPVHPRTFVDPNKSAGDSDGRIHMQLALSALSKRDKAFLTAYIVSTIPELALIYRISCHACHCRASAIRRKIAAIARMLMERK
jgi:hypothetical protein